MKTTTCPHCGGVLEKPKPLAYTVKENTASGEIMRYLDSQPGRQTSKKAVSNYLREKFGFKSANVGVSMRFLSGISISGRNTIPTAYVITENGIIKIKDEVILFR